ncbi:MAG: glycosyltransferase [Candidatus Hydrogenedens sp.]|nr:glycosyltransferase [Candidatus Hydrogenedens sp.]
MPEPQPYRISIVIPVYNEESSLPQLCAEIIAAMQALPEYPYEIIFVDDASTDRSFPVIEELSAQHPGLVGGVQLRRNFGQTAAMAAGFDLATGEVILPMDGDLQNDPADIPRFIEQINAGFDLVSGWRVKREDPYVSRVLPSRMANGIISFITGVHLHDYGCTMKAYHRAVIEHISFYGEMHRLLPAVASWGGARITEIQVNHRPRMHGKSKYGIGRTISVILDLFTVKFLLTYATKPMRVFGGVGLVLAALGIASGVVSVVEKITPPYQDVTSSGWMFIAIFLMLGGLQFLSIGLLGEISIRTYFESQRKPTYTVRRKLPIQQDVPTV